MSIHNKSKRDLIIWFSDDKNKKLKNFFHNIRGNFSLSNMIYEEIDYPIILNLTLIKIIKADDIFDIYTMNQDINKNIIDSFSNIEYINDNINNVVKQANINEKLYLPNFIVFPSYINLVHNNILR